MEISRQNVPIFYCCFRCLNFFKNTMSSQVESTSHGHCSCSLLYFSTFEFPQPPCPALLLAPSSSVCSSLWHQQTFPLLWFEGVALQLHHQLDSFFYKFLQPCLYSCLSPPPPPPPSFRLHFFCNIVIH